MRTTCFLLILLLPLCGLIAQNTPEEYLKWLSPLPENICIQTPEAIAKWSDSLNPLIDRMKGVLLQENNDWEDAVANGKFNMAMADPDGPAAARGRSLNEKMQELQQKVNVSFLKIWTVYRDAKVNLIIKYDEPFNELTREYTEAQTAGRNTAELKERIRAMEMNRCEEMAHIRRDYLNAYRGFLYEYMPTFVRQNEIKDEVNRIQYESFEFRTRYGAWLEHIMKFAEELRLVFDDAPDSGAIDMS